MESYSIGELRKEIKIRDGRNILHLSGHSLRELPVAVMELTELEELYLTENKLQTIPENIRKLINLTRLDLYGNQLSIFPASLTHLKKLKWLDISYNEWLTTDAIGEMGELEILYLKKNQLTVLSPAITQLKKLKKLYMTGNKLTTIPDAIGEMVGLEVLELNYNKLTELSPAIKQLKKLKELSIAQNQLTTIPDTIGEMVDLEKLDLSHNQLTVLSSNIKQLRKLKVLEISDNKLTTIPNAIGEMENLKTLDLSDNKLSVLSPALKQLKKLKYLYVDKNPFTVEGVRSVMELEDKIGRVSSAIPDHVERQRAEGRKADLAFEWALKDGYVRVNRGRIMLIGQDRAGKTSLMKNLLGLPFDPNEQSTEGIEVNPSKCEIDVERVRNWQPTDENKPGLEEYAKEVAKIIAEKLVRRHGKDSEDNAGEDSEDSPLEDSFDDEEEAEENKGSKFSQYSKEENLPNEPEAQINASSPPDDIRRHLHLWLEYVKCKGDISREVVQSLDIWDFAGQHLYYASYPIFLSPRALYILVHNLSKPLDALAEPCVRQGMIDVELKNPNNETNVENLLSWLATVHSLAQVPINEEKHDDSPHKLPYLRPPVLIVGTHADKPVDGIALMKKHIEERIFHKEYDKHVIRPLFCIDNTRSSSKQLANESNGDNSCGDAIDSLQNRIIEVLNKEPYMEEKIPVRWFLFEKVIEALVDKQIYHSSLRQLQDYAEKWCFVEDSNEFNSMISFYHDLGMIIKHRSTVVLKAQWLIDLFKQLIIIPRYNDMLPIYSKSWRKLYREGILSTELADHVLSGFIKESFIKEDILKMMEQFGLISKFTLSSTDVKYFVPAQLKSSPEDLLKMKPSPTDPCPLYIHFVHGFVPHGLFLQLVSRTIRWCSEKWPMKGPKLYQNGAWCYIGKQALDLILICEMRFIKITVRQRKALMEKVQEVAKHVREFVEQTLHELPQELLYLRGLQYETCVACPYCHPESDEDSQECAIHGKVSCTHEDCFHLLKIEQDQALICFKKVCFEERTVRGMERWFSEGESQESNPSSEICTSQRSIQQKYYVKQGTPTNLELEMLAAQIGEKWGSLGRRLEVEDAKLEDIEQSHRRLNDRAYDMLKHWKQKEGCEATYQILNGALQDELVQRKDLAETFCCHQGSPAQIIQELQQMQLDARKIKSRTDPLLGLREIASDKGFRISDNQGSGNCMFYALSEQLEIVKGIKIPPGRLRQTLVQYLRSNPKLPDGTDLLHFVDGHQTWTEYLTHMEQDGTWGDHVILCTAANCYETCIRVVSSLADSNDVIITPHCPVEESQPLVLGHIHEVHYVSFLPAHGHIKKRRLEDDGFPCQEEETSKRLKKD